MNNNWETELLKDHMDSCLGKMLDKNKNKGEFHPYLGNKSVRWGRFDLDELQEMRFEDKEHERYSLKYGDLVVCEGGEPGRCAIWKDQIPNMKIQKALHRIRPHKSLNNLYLYYWLSWSGKNGLLDAYFTGTTIKHLTGKALSSVKLPIPPLAIQENIAHILGSLDEKIELNRQMNETLEAMTQALFKSWFVDFDPVIDNALAADHAIPDVFAERAAQRKAMNDEAINPLFPDAFEYTEEMGWIPERWKIKTLNDTTTEIIDHRGKTPKKLGSDWSEYGYPAISAKNVKGNKLVRPDTIRYVNKDLYEKWMKIPLEKGDIAMTSEAPLGELYYFNSKTDYLLSQRLYGIRADGINCTGPYLFNWLQTELGATDLQNRATGTTVVGIKQSELRKVAILCPCAHVLKSYDSLTNGYLEKMDANDISNTSLAKLRDTLLPKLLSGELRIPDAEKLVEEATANKVGA